MEPNRPLLSRRRLLKTAAAVSAPWVLPSVVFGLDGATAPSNRIALGMIGIGAMGQGHLRCFVNYPTCQVVAVCDVDRSRRERAKAVVEEAYATAAPGGKYRGCDAINDLRDVISRPDIDAVVIATGDRWQGLATVMAAKAGKDVYCEKPCCLTIQEARAMIDTVRRYGRVFQAGLQQRSDGAFRKACDLVLAGALGKIQIVYVTFPGTSTDVSLPAEPVPEGLDWDLWLGPAPWRPYHHSFHPYGQPHGVVPWHFCRDFGGLNLTSNAVHAFDVVQWGLGMDQSGPVEIIPPETGQVPSLTYKYASGTLVQVTWKLERGKHDIPPGWDENTAIQPFGALFVGEHGWIHVGRQGYLKFYPQQVIERSPVWNDHSHAVHNHHEGWLDCIRTRKRTACDVEAGCRSTIVSHLGCIAHWTGRALRWDPVREVFPGDAEANRWIARAMRSPWRL
ncbi:MAG: Gfo/Idh/MocA family oxidoreductase [Thermoguttaceae bacterium]|nr:Gfo/Idh/MocA family oxidoreductase [Thermoguttaceae bacterium]